MNIASANGTKSKGINTKTLILLGFIFSLFFFIDFVLIVLTNKIGMIQVINVDIVNRFIYGVFSKVSFVYQYHGYTDVGTIVLLFPSNTIHAGSQLAVRMLAFPRIIVIEEYLPNQLAGSLGLSVLSLGCSGFYLLRYLQDKKSLIPAKKK